MWARHSSLLSLATAACATGAMVVASSCSSSGTGFGTDDGGTTTGVSVGSGCSGLSTCCASLPAGDVDQCNTIVTANDDTTCSAEIEALQASGYCGGGTVTTGSATTSSTTGVTTTTTGTTTGVTTATTGTTTGVTTATTGTTTGASTTTGTTTGSTCSAASAGGIALMMNYLPASAMIGMGGYAYAYSDMSVGGPSNACVDSNALCGSGSSGPANTMAVGTVAAYGYYGGGIGVNLNQAMGAGTTMMTYTATGAGVTYALSVLPAGARLVIDNAGTDYCANLTSASGTVMWSSFNTKCYDSPADGTALAAAPSATHVEFQVPASMTAETWAFCVTTLTL